MHNPIVQAAMRKRQHTGISTPPRPLGQLLQLWLQRLAAHSPLEQTRPLWLAWEEIMGPDLTPLALPLGQRGRKLLVGAEDSLAMQELSYSMPDILEKANEFMATSLAPTEGTPTPYFEGVELKLMFGKEALDKAKHARQAQKVRQEEGQEEGAYTGATGRTFIPPRRERPEHLGGLQDIWPEDAPLRRYYMEYVAAFNQPDNEQ